MRSPARFLLSSKSNQSATAPPPTAIYVGSDVVVILAALLCALICVVGLALVARCAWLRRSLTSSSSSPPPPPNKGVKKKVLRSLPTVAFDSGASAGKLADCAICLAEFSNGDEIRILPQCGHGFHAGCIDTWLRSHRSCPSCRRILVVPAAATCQKCGANSGEETAVKSGDGGGFLP